MKKKLLMGVFGLGLMLSVVSVQAQTIDTAEGTASADVTVWNVDTPVYNVEIEWEDLSFDWLYNEDTDSYGWEKNMDNVIEGALITIIDNSENMTITPLIEWNSAENYDWTIGNFYSHYNCLEISENEFDEIMSTWSNIYTDSSCSSILEDKNVTWSDNSYYYNNAILQGYNGKEESVMARNKIATKEISDSFRHNDMYELHFALETDETKEIKTPQIGDTIGTITISIK